ncbi:hypothetical protein ACH5RR_022964 [Cinchona calisaya]|uniref:Uncharacterized protein n=1 Tax=Cinchona calisaya TaxID=153742 RepID=A0ABD2ZD79_9GENT
MVNEALKEAEQRVIRYQGRHDSILSQICSHYFVNQDMEEALAGARGAMKDAQEFAVILRNLQIKILNSFPAYRKGDQTKIQKYDNVANELSKNQQHLASKLQSSKAVIDVGLSSTDAVTSSDLKMVQVVFVNDEHHRLPELSNNGFSSFGYGEVAAPISQKLLSIYKEHASSTATQSKSKPQV